MSRVIKRMETCKSGRSKRIAPARWGKEVGEGKWGRFAGFPPFPKSLSDLDLQMFYYADAFCGRVFYCSISGHPRQGAGGRHAGTRPDSLLLGVYSLNSQELAVSPALLGI